MPTTAPIGLRLVGLEAKCLPSTAALARSSRRRECGEGLFLYARIARCSSESFLLDTAVASACETLVRGSMSLSERGYEVVGRSGLGLGTLRLRDTALLRRELVRRELTGLGLGAAATGAGRCVLRASVLGTWPCDSMNRVKHFAKSPASPPHISSIMS